MTYRKGELSSAGIDRHWPYQVALNAVLCSCKNFEIHREFNIGRSICARGHSVSFESKWYHVFCYSLKDDAEAFMAHFGGEWFDTRERGKGVNLMRWSRDKFSGVV